MLQDKKSQLSKIGKEENEMKARHLEENKILKDLSGQIRDLKSRTAGLESSVSIVSL